MLWGMLGLIAAVVLVLVLTHDGGQVGSLATGDFARLGYLVLIVVPLLGALAVQLRGRLGAGLKQAAIWLALLVALVAGYAHRLELKVVGERTLSAFVPGYVASGGTGEAQVSRGRDGHFTLTAGVNGVRVAMLVDTGASTLALRHEDAVAIGLDPARLDFAVPIMTANGETLAAPVTIDQLDIGPIRLVRVRALVSRPGALDRSLLGLNVLDRLSSYRVEGDTLILRR